MSLAPVKIQFYRYGMLSLIQFFTMALFSAYSITVPENKGDFGFIAAYGTELWSVAPALLGFSAIYGVTGYFCIFQILKPSLNEITG